MISGVPFSFKNPNIAVQQRPRAHQWSQGHTEWWEQPGRTSPKLLPIDCACVLSHCRRVGLFATLWAVAGQIPLPMGFSRQEYWSGLPCPPPGDLPDAGINPSCLCLGHWQTGSLPLTLPGEPYCGPGLGNSEPASIPTNLPHLLSMLCMAPWNSRAFWFRKEMNSSCHFQKLGSDFRASSVPGASGEGWLFHRFLLREDWRFA